ncbi:hypothetical protein [Parasphaerochaeta coccoides]|uniref:Uncharacterized protein n=1 Tax=Parasphaerochaeta coccoides (strain ATCC BAA-1237 / DSM 17374 / SPN1) TaxID=760011 RepID=F4GJR6_PARC1|nr:hypothetical protein [Parasphaerochaeta coccoides]AEC02813.1 hypothetical protein Spico_1612 [Parasphaerochaeta coccoides DSM 17374]
MHKTSNKLILGATIFLVVTTVMTVISLKMITNAALSQREAANVSTVFLTQGSLKNDGVVWIEKEDIV